jgi:uracil-DNA glycosylase family 4
VVFQGLTSLGTGCLVRAMDAGGNSAALVVLDWWRQSGVDVLIDEAPRNWLATSRPAPPPAEPMLAPATLPTTLSGFHGWLADQAGPGGAPPIPPNGDAAAGLMLLAGMPTNFDTPQTGLFAGSEGQLLDAMLGAIGRDRASIYLTSLASHRPDGGKIGPTALAELALLARHHIGLAAPKAMLLLGDEPSRALLDLPATAARGRIHQISVGEITVNVVVTFTPQMLLKRPASKADCWADLRRLLEELNR